MRRLKVYISGPMAGVADYKERFSRAEALIARMGDDPVNPALVHLESETAAFEYLLCDLWILARCDAIYLLPDWERSCGARIEKLFADYAGKSTVEYCLPGGDADAPGVKA